MKFESVFKHVGRCDLPKPTNTRIMMMPILIGSINSLPDNLSHYRPTMYKLFRLAHAKHWGDIGYLTIDEKLVKAGETHRRGGLHVDGVLNGKCGGWGGGGGWGSVGNGMLTVASVSGCKAYNQKFEGTLGNDGEADQLKEQCIEEKGLVFKPFQVYWVDGLCVHESIPMDKDTNRTFVRLSMPSKAPWFEGYTENPLGIKPTGVILSKRKFM